MADARDDDLFELIARDTAPVASGLVSAVARFMTTAREICEGDADKVLLMLVIALRANSHPEFRQGSPDQLADSSGALPSLGVNMRSLADSTGIPRETVRRKVQELIAWGWVVQKGSTLHYSLAGYQAVTPVRMEILRCSVTAYRVIAARLREVGREA